VNSVPAGHIRAEGSIKNVNTIEDFKNADKAQLLHRAAKTVGLQIRIAGLDIDCFPRFGML
jgi:hypothetical protein